MSQKFVNKLFKKALESAAGAGGRMFGTRMASKVLAELGMQGDQLGDLQAEVAEIKGTLTRIEQRLDGIERSLAWLNNDAIYSAARARVSTVLRRVRAIEADVSMDEAERRLQMTSLLDEDDAAQIETDLTALNDMIMGDADAIRSGESAFATMYRTHWDLFHDSARSMTIEDAADVATGIWLRLAELQGDALGVCMLRHVLKGHDAQANSVLRFVVNNLHAQWRELCHQTPDLVVWLLSGYEIDGQEGFNWSFTFKTTVRGARERWFSPDDDVVVTSSSLGQDVFSGMAARAQEINVVPHPDKPGHFYLRRLDTMRAMGYTSVSVLAQPKTLSHPSGGPRPHRVNALPAAHEEHMMPFMFVDPGPEAAPARFFTTDRHDVYAFGDPGGVGMVTLLHWGEQVSDDTRRKTGAQSFNLYKPVALTALDGLSEADVRRQATTWTVQCAPGAPRTQLLTSAGVA